ncbi:MAG: hypothetical protein CAPSK01_000583 [Candidatus Accumulibacter vicinus]|uniref:Uncharacterized protein n=1 Tax=Candidatus Accumulibacter vicinus TaxID=2954382 RepID=A0A084Y4V5_9PROT|nr:MAG: hypothetical protein CAPSK01_000583 [Candidatus Accumulibacter vicinus]
MIWLPGPAFCVYAADQYTGVGSKPIPIVCVIVPTARTPSELAPGVTDVTVRVSRNVPSAVVNSFVKMLPIVTPIGSGDRVINWPATRPTLFETIAPTRVGAPLVMVVAVVTSPVSAVKLPSAATLKMASIGMAEAGVDNAAAADVTATAHKRENFIG